MFTGKAFLYLFFVTFGLSIFSQQNNEFCALRISAVINNSKEAIGIPQKGIEITEDKKIILAHKNIDIPFISISEYIKEYTKGAQGRAYIPKGALLIKIGNRTFGLWENEKGIIYSPASQISFDEESWPVKLFNNLNKRKPNRPFTSILKLLLAIDKNGYLKLENFKTYSDKALNQQTS